MGNLIKRAIDFVFKHIFEIVLGIVGILFGAVLDHTIGMKAIRERQEKELAKTKELLRQHEAKIAECHGDKARIRKLERLVSADQARIKELESKTDEK